MTALVESLEDGQYALLLHENEARGEVTQLSRVFDFG